MDSFPGRSNINLNWWSSISGRKKRTPSTTTDRVLGSSSHLSSLNIVRGALMSRLAVQLLREKASRRILLSWLIRPIRRVTCIHSRNQSKGIQVVAGRIWYLSLEYLVRRDSFVSDHCLLKPGFTWSHSNHKKWMKWEPKPLLNKKDEEFYPFSFIFSRHFLSFVSFWNTSFQASFLWRKEGRK